MPNSTSNFDLFRIASTFVIGGATALLYLRYEAQKAREYSLSDSPYEIAFTTLKIGGKVITQTTEEKVVQVKISDDEAAESLLKIFHMAGYFKPENLWKDINGFGIYNKEKFFQDVMQTLIKSDAAGDDPSKFNAAKLRKNLFKNTNISKEDATDFIIYLSQNAFGRNAGQERNELQSVDWMKTHKDLFMEQAKKLGMVDGIEPSQKSYDAAWIAGASRIGALTRIIDYIQKHKEHKLVIKYDTMILAGARPLWAEIDGISPDTKSLIESAFEKGVKIDNLNTTLAAGNDEDRTEEGKEYIKNLAQKNDIKLNENQPFISYSTKLDCPPGYELNRHYPNYAEGETRKLTESLMCNDLLKTYATQSGIKIKVVDTESGQDTSRPTTATTAEDAVKQLVSDNYCEIESNNRENASIKILLISNNPYIERQALQAEVIIREPVRLTNETLILSCLLAGQVEGVGFRNKQDVPTTHSELAALLSVKYQAAGIKSSREEESLMYQTRQKDFEFSSMPAIKITTISLRDILVDYFDDPSHEILKALGDFFDYAQADHFN